MKKFTVITILLSSLWFPQPGRAQNSHEHFYSLPPFDYFMAAYHSTRFLYSSSLKSTRLEYYRILVASLKAKGYRIEDPVKSILESTELSVLHAPIRELSARQRTLSHLDIIEKLTLDPKLAKEVTKIGGLHPEFGNLPLTHFASSPNGPFRMASFIKDIFGLQVLEDLLKTSPEDSDGNTKNYDKRLKIAYGNLAIGDFARLVKKSLVHSGRAPATTSTLDILRTMFEFTPHGQQDRAHYQAAEAIRKNFIRNMTENRVMGGQSGRFLKELFGHLFYNPTDSRYVETPHFKLPPLPVGQQVHTTLSVPWEFYDRNLLPQPGKTSSSTTAVSSAFQGRTAAFDQLNSELVFSEKRKVSYLLSYPRNRLLSDPDVATSKNELTFSHRLAKLEKGLQEGWGKGIDITGSIEESLYQNSSPEEFRLYQQRLTLIFDLMARHGGIAQVHAYEDAREGAFYEALRESLKVVDSRQYPKKPIIQIGHINKLKPEDIAFFKSLSNLQLEFQANVESNHRLHQSGFKELAETVHLLDSQGFHVHLGSDGFGILGTESDFMSSLDHLIEGGLPPRTALKLAIQYHVHSDKKSVSNGEVEWFLKNWNERGPESVLGRNVRNLDKKTFSFFQNLVSKIEPGLPGTAPTSRPEASNKRKRVLGFIDTLLSIGSHCGKTTP